MIQIALNCGAKASEQVTHNVYVPEGRRIFDDASFLCQKCCCQNRQNSILGTTDFDFAVKRLTFSYY